MELCQIASLTESLAGTRVSTMRASESLEGSRLRAQPRNVSLSTGGRDILDEIGAYQTGGNWNVPGRERERERRCIAQGRRREIGDRRCGRGAERVAFSSCGGLCVPQSEIVPPGLSPGAYESSFPLSSRTFSLPPGPALLTNFPRYKPSKNFIPIYRTILGRRYRPPSDPDSVANDCASSSLVHNVFDV